MMARRRGIPVADITLWLFGGVSHIHGDWGTARSEMLVAVVGPAVTLGLTTVFLGITLLLHVAGAPTLAIVVPQWLTAVNLTLLAFNLIPAFPLDGGRILRGALWAWRGNRASATVAAARGGRAFGFLLIIAGLVDFFLTADFSGIWIVFIGWFLESAARGEQRGEMVRHALEGLTVGDVMSREPVVVPSWITVRLLIEQYAMRHQFTTFPTHNVAGDIDGLVTLQRMKRVPANQRSHRRASDIASPIADGPRATSAEPLPALLARVGPQSDGRSLVFDGDQLVGVVSPSDVARRLQLSPRRRAQPSAA
jgi:hypothetical protein